mmetsp:Transcript_19019/g.27242  ORF Transcript_19019/g.27242 Transcript_19019/m.27242 type:complete len:763 (+) Transcript_19019:38-2326(+)
MTTLAEDIKALMDLGHGLESATELAVADRKKTTQAVIPPAVGDKRSIHDIGPQPPYKGEQRDLFNEYYCGDSMLNVAKILEKSVDSVLKDRSYYNVITLVNSSCVGKTKAILEYAKNHRVVYFLCKNIDRGFLMPDVFSKMIVHWAKETEPDAREYVADKILDCIFEAAKDYPNAVDLFNAQFVDCRLGGEYHNTLNSKWASAITPGATATKERLENSRVGKDLKRECLVVAWDEADGLFHKSDRSSLSHTEGGAFRCFLRRINMRENMIAIVSSTSSDIAQLSPGHGGSNNRGICRTDFPPVFKIVNVNLSPTFERDYRVFQYGRGIFRNISDNMNEVVAFATDKLTNSVFSISNDGDYFIKGSEKRKFQQTYLALFYCRFGISNITYLAKDLVSDNMAVLVRLDLQEGSTYGTYNHYCECKYLSEPAFCEASARITECAEGVQLLTIKEVTNVVGNNKPIVASLGDCGEMALAAAITYVKDRCLRNNWGSYDYKEWYDANQPTANFSSPLSFITLLYGLKGKKVVDKVVAAHPQLKSMTVSFTHFVRYPILTDLMVAVAYDRRMAFYAPQNCAGYDKYISIRYTRDDKSHTDIGWYLQDKNYVGALGEAATNDILNDMYPPLIPPKDPEAAFFSVCCLCTTGGGAHDICEVVEIDSGVFQLRFTLDLWEDFPLLANEVKRALYALARPGVHSQTTEMDEVLTFSGLHDVVFYDRNDKAAVRKRLNSMLRSELLNVCNRFGMSGYSKLKKADLLQFVTDRL